MSNEENKENIGINLDNIPVEISVHLGTVSMCMSEVRDIRIDQVLKLSRKVNDAVELRVNGRIIAEGLIDVQDDEVHVKILRIINN